MAFGTHALDLALWGRINCAWRSPVLDAVLPFFSLRWPIWVIGALVFAWLWRRGGFRSAAGVLLIVVSVGLADASNTFLKDVFRRERPLNTQPACVYQEDGQWRQRPDDFVPKGSRGDSYPSGHSANTMAVAACAMLLWPRTRPWLLLLPLLTGYSRIYLGRHYPADVLGGWLVGLGAVLALFVAIEAVCPRLLRWLRSG